ncbi:unnamed protein product [Rodentolepis nana]|uniref:leucine--tRNA ligase n=1 Tax=Rodentolepis nana TaxID=102285 RepID=A0A3P7SXB3_RODNA|nr:unnamed protein product [Rodentolepis nana]
MESWEKMSKSKLNGVEPSEVVSRHGLEVTRLTMLASVGPHAARQWNEGEILIGVKHWQSRMWKLIRRLTEFANNPSTRWPSPDRDDYLAANANFMKTHARIIEQVHHHYCDSFVLSAVIASLQKLTNILLKDYELIICTGHGKNYEGERKVVEIPPPRRCLTQASRGIKESAVNERCASSRTFLRAVGDLIVMLHPLAPMFSCELWSGFSRALRAAPGENLEFLSEASQWRYDLFAPAEISHLRIGSLS